MLYIYRRVASMIHDRRNTDVHLKRIFGLYNLVNALRASKIISIHTATSSFQHFS